MTEPLKNRRMIRPGVSTLLAVFSLLWFASPVLAEDMGSSVFSAAVKESELAKMRGGFALGNGTVVYFAIVAHTEVNGVNVNQWSWSNSDTNPLQTTIVQVGENNVMTPDSIAGAPSIANIIQNTQNDVVIRRSVDIFMNLSIADTLASDIQSQALLGLDTLLSMQ